VKSKCSIELGVPEIPLKLVTNPYPVYSHPIHVIMYKLIILLDVLQRHENWPLRIWCTHKDPNQALSKYTLESLPVGPLCSEGMKSAYWPQLALNWGKWQALVHVEMKLQVSSNMVYLTT
jgi:hypothetical protein